MGFLLLIPVLMYVIFFTYVITNGKGNLRKMDILIAQFKAKNYSTMEEREKAKEELKTKLISIKGNIRSHSTGYMATATNKILGL